MIKILKNTVIQEQPDVMLSFLLENNIRAILTGKLLNIPVVISVRVDPQMECTSAMRRILRRMFYNYAGGVVLQNDGSKERFGKWFHANYRIIPNPINEKFIDAAPSIEHKKIIVSVGRLTEQKNHLMLIRAFASLANEYPNYKLIIFGEGKMRMALEEEINNLRMQNRIFLPGVVDDVQNYLKQAEIFVLASDYEGVPNALLEAMSLGLPCIATDVPNGGCRDIIENSVNGLLVPIQNQSELVRAMRFMLNNKEVATEMGIEAMKVREKYSPDYVYGLWEDYLFSFMKR